MSYASCFSTWWSIMTFIQKDPKVSSFMLVYTYFLSWGTPLTNCTTCWNHKYFCQQNKKFKHIRIFWVFGHNFTYCNFSFTRGHRSVKKAKCVFLWKTKGLQEVAFHFSKCSHFIFPFFPPMIATYIMETNGGKNYMCFMLDNSLKVGHTWN